MEQDVEPFGEDVEVNELIEIRDLLRQATRRLNRVIKDGTYSKDGRELALAKTNVEQGLLWLKAVGNNGRWME